MNVVGSITAPKNIRSSPLEPVNVPLDGKDSVDVMKGREIGRLS